MIGEYATGPAVIVPARVALMLYRELDIDRARAELRGQDRQVDSVLASWAQIAAQEVRASVGSVAGTALGDPVPGGGSSVVMTTTDVAGAARITVRAVRKAATNGTLTGSRPGHAWMFSPVDVADWLARRQGDR